MADDLVSQDRWDAGADYLAALESLGLVPEALLWAQRDSDKQLVLFIISAIVDRVGSSEIYDTLFKAYDHAITPRSIDPWNVSVCSPDTVIGTEFQDMMNMTVGKASFNGISIETEAFFGMGGKSYLFKKSWVYVAHKQRMESRRQMVVWRTFQQNVDRRAA